MQQQQSPKIHEANTNKIEERNKQWSNKFYILQYPTFNNDQNKQEQTKKRPVKIFFKGHYEFCS